MSWLFSRVLVAEYWADTCLGGVPFAPLSVMPTPHRFWRNDRTMDFFRLSRFGLTCAVLTANHGEALLMWFREAFLARTSPSAVTVPESTAPDPAFGNRWAESSVRFDLDSAGWRTHPCSSPEALPWSSVTLPKWGMTRSGVVYQRLNVARRIAVTGSGSWPTPVASMAKGSSPGSLIRKNGRDRSRDRLDHAVMALHGGPLNPEWVEWLMGWPIGWTDLRPLGMGRFQRWWELHSERFPK
jgi:hypothetical protein